MRWNKVIRELPIGLIIIAAVIGFGFFKRYMNRRGAPNQKPPPAGELYTGPAATKLHPPIGVVEAPGAPR